MASRAERATARATANDERQEQEIAERRRLNIANYLLTRAPETERVYTGHDIQSVLQGPVKRLTDPSLPAWVLDGGQRVGLEHENVKWEPADRETSHDFEFLSAKIQAAAHLSALREWGVSPSFLKFADATMYHDSTSGQDVLVSLAEPCPVEFLASRLKTFEHDGPALMHAFKNATCQVLLALEAAQYRVGFVHYSFVPCNVHVGTYEFEDPETTHALYARPGSQNFYISSSYLAVNRVILDCAAFAETHSPHKCAEPASASAAAAAAEGPKTAISTEAASARANDFAACVRTFFADVVYDPPNPYDSETDRELHTGFNTVVLTRQSDSHILRQAIRKLCDTPTFEIIKAGVSGKYMPSEMLNMPYFDEFRKEPENAKVCLIGNAEAC